MPFRFLVYAEIKGHLQGNQQNNEYEATAKYQTLMNILHLETPFVGHGS